MKEQRERRRIPRIPTTVRVELEGGEWLIAHDISLGGMLATTRTPRWPGELLRLRFRLPGEERAIRATCRVVDLVDVPHGSGLALQFLRLHHEAQLQLCRYVDSRPMTTPEDATVVRRVQDWVRRMVEDCAQLEALARC